MDYVKRLSGMVREEFGSDTAAFNACKVIISAIIATDCKVVENKPTADMRLAWMAVREGFDREFSVIFSSAPAYPGASE